MTLLWQVRDRTMSLARPLVMGIVNVTPDSFSDGGQSLEVDDAVARASAMLGEGADILDVGGESTRPQAVPVPADEERRRVVPVIRAIVAAHPAAVVSVDTVKSDVAEAAIHAGAHIVNDVSGLTLDARMSAVCARAGVGVVVMHSRGGVADMATYEHASYGADVVGEVLAELLARVARAMASGVARECIAIDPGIGFAKRSAHSLQLLDGLARLVDAGHPVVVGASRKRFIGEIDGRANPAARAYGSIGAAVAAFARGANIFRVHDVAATREALDVAAAIKAAGALGA